MSLFRYLWRVTRQDNNQYETIFTEDEPLVAPSDGGAIFTDQTTIISSDFTSIINRGYINIESTLADNQALKINASDVNGGIDIDSGFGGITMDTTNTISLNAAAESDFTTSNGNLILESTNGLVNIVSGSGINVGTTETTPINIGNGNTTTITTTSNSFSINGNNGPSNITLNSAVDGDDLTIFLGGSNDSSIIMESSGTGADALKFNTTGGIDIDATKK